MTEASAGPLQGETLTVSVVPTLPPSQQQQQQQGQTSQRVATASIMRQSETRQRIKEEEMLLEEFEADDRVFLERRFVTFCIVIAIIIAVFSVFIYIVQTQFVPVTANDVPEIHLCLENARLALQNACTAYNVTCKNSMLVIDVAS